MELFSDIPVLLRYFCVSIYWLLDVLFTFVGIWWIAIVLLALVLRVLLYPFTSRARRVQNNYTEKYKGLEDELKSIKAKYSGGDQSEKIIELYKQHDLSPFGGLKSLGIVLLQVPILIGLYQVLLKAPQLKNAQFFWIDSLAKPDHTIPLNGSVLFIGEFINVFPVIMALVSIIAVKIQNSDSSSKMMIGMNIMFLFLFYHFPSGLILYWTVANLLQMLEYKFIVKL